MAPSSTRHQDITHEKPAQTARRGIVRSFQISAVFPHMTVLENVRAALQRNLGTSFHFWKPETVAGPLHQRAQELLEAVDLGRFAGELTVNLPYGRKRALELATTMALEPELMLLDEPTQGMGHEDVHRVTELIKKISAGRTILMVEHNMNVVASIADRITVLQRGFKGQVTVIPEPREMTVFVSLMKVLAGKESLAEFVMKMTRSFETALAVDVYNAFYAAMDAVDSTADTGLLVAGYSQSEFVRLAQTVTACMEWRRKSSCNWHSACFS